MLTSVKEKGREIAVPKLGQAEEGQSQRPCHLHAPVLRHDRRRLTARAVPRHPRRSSRSTNISSRSSVKCGRTWKKARRSRKLMARHPKVFDQLFVNMIEAGETGGILDLILQRLSTFIEKIVKLGAT